MISFKIKMHIHLSPIYVARRYVGYIHDDAGNLTEDGFKHDTPYQTT